MKYYVLGGDVLANNADSDNLPNGWSIAEFEDHPCEHLYYDGSEIRLRGAKPSDTSYWSSIDQQWLEYTTVPGNDEATYLPTENWAGLLNSLRNSAVFTKAYDASGKTLKANTAFTMLLTTLTSTCNLSDLQFSITQLRDALKSQTSLADFTSEELAYIQNVLEKNNFDSKQFDLT